MNQHYIENVEDFKHVTDITVRNTTQLTKLCSSSFLIPMDNDIQTLYTEADTILPPVVPSRCTLFDLCSDPEHKEGLLSYLEKIKTRQLQGGCLLLDCKYKKQGVDEKKKSLEIKISCATFHDEDCLVFIFRDTTQRDTIMRLESNNRYKDSLLASVSHELRTPLNGNLNFIDTAIADPALPAHIKEQYLIPALRTGTLLMHLINDILDLCQINANQLRLNFGLKSIRDTLNECLELVQLQAVKKKITMKFIYDEEIPSTFSTDHNRVTQIVLNLLNNAVKFTLENGEIKLKVERIQDVNIQISVTDSGIGIEKSEQKKLFKKFSKHLNGDQKDLNKNGVGLGLAISNALAERLGPTGLKVDSVVGKGSTFTLIVSEKTEMTDNATPQMEEPPSLPAQEVKSRDLETSNDDSIDNMMETEKSAPPPPSIRFPRIMPKVNKTRCKSMMPYFNTSDSSSDSALPIKLQCTCPKILVVDDDAFNIMAFEKMLQVLGLNADTAYNGQQGVNRILARQNKPCSHACKQYQIIFMDVCMPIMDGFQATKHLRTNSEVDRRQSLNIVGCTAFTAKEKLQECIQSGMNEVISKPLSKDRLSDILRKYNVK
jgi:CheY-like chemotaxis protein/nitrogen-specific signal transduction histidine kinase